MLITKKIIKKFLFRFVIFLLFAIIPTFWVIQNSEKVQLFAKNKLIKILEKEWNSKITVESSDFNLFTGTIFFNNGKVISCIKDSNCWWKFKLASVRFSRLLYFLKDIIQLNLKFFDIDAFSSYENNKLSIKEHLKDVLTPSKDFEIDLQSVKIHNLRLNLLFGEKNIFLETGGDFNFERLKNDQNKYFWSGNLSFEKGEILIDRKTFLKQIKGITSFSIGKFYDDDLNIKIDKKFELIAQDKNKVFFLNGMWNQSEKIFVLKNINDLIDLQINFIDNEHFKILGEFPIQLLKEIYNFWDKNFLADNKINGICKFDSTFNLLNDFNGGGKIKLKDINFDSINIGNLKIVFKHKNNKLSSVFKVDNIQKDIKISGKSFWNLDKKFGKLFLKNSNEINISNQISWFIKDSDLKVAFNITKDFNLLGKYKLCFSKRNSSETLLFDGNYFFKNKKIQISGKALQNNYILKGLFSPDFYLTKFLYLNKGEKIIDVFLDKKTKKLFGKVRYIFLKSFLPDNLKKMIFGHNTNLYFSLKQNKYDSLLGSTVLSGGRLSLLGSYNPIERIKINFFVDFLKKKILFNDSKIDFFQGKISCSQAAINFNEDYSLNFINVPLKADNLLINWKRDFYGIVQGDLFLSKQLITDQPQDSFLKVFGNLNLKKSLIRENIFSEKTENSSWNFFIAPQPIIPDDHGIKFDINLKNEEFIKTKTSFLESDVDLDLNLKALFFNNKIHIPQVTGHISLEKGFLKFLHHKLYINYGRIQFMPNLIEDPIIDLVARNKIKKYIISLHATGSFHKPNIILESSPELTEEEILALLIAGSEDASFQADLPSILMQNLNNLVISSKNFLPQALSFFKKITLPFKYVQIIPDFTNQFGRGGIKGTVSIDFNKQIHAQIQKNFNLQEDLAFQLEYFLTDDVNLKMVKNQLGELGAEVEVRFKL